MKHGTTPPAVRNLLSRPGPERVADIEKTLAPAAGAMPLSAAHAKDLPFAVRDLSRLLTSERDGLARSYWASPRLASAYLRYFLPWNLYRLAWLLPGLALDLEPGASVLDLGSGPLTLPLALWCARPDLRSVPLRFVCVDVAAKAMEHGKSILSSVAGPESPWTVELVRAPFDRAIRQARDKNYALVMAGNVLNEICACPPEADTHLAGRLEDMAAFMADALAPGGRLLLIEPGTRLGGKLIALFRKGALRHALAPLSPCTHEGPCPMEAAAAHGGSAYSGWCHFIHPVSGAPASLENLTRRAHLEKESLAVSCLFLERPARTGGADTRGSKASFAVAAEREADELDELEVLYREMMEEDAGASGPGIASAPVSLAERPFAARCPMRVISGPIRLPGHEEPARYACCEYGLVLLEDARRIPSGAGAVAALPERPRRDAKTGALLLRPAGEKKTRENTPAPAEKKNHTRPEKRKRNPPSGKNRPGAKSDPSGPR